MTDQPMEMSGVAPRAERRVQTGGGLPFWAVFKRELALYFRSPIAYGIAFAVLLLLGILFNGYINASNGQAPANSTVIPTFFSSLAFVVIPLLTMRLIAEETREGTLEVLMTLPMGEGQFILGKFLAAWAYYTVLILLIAVFYFILTIIGTPDQGEAFGAYFGAWLLGGALLAVTMIWSAITEDQIVAAFLSAASVLILYFADFAADWFATQFNSPALAGFVRELGLQAHYYSTMARGVIRAEDVLYFVFLIVGALFITTRIVETRRWRS